MFIQTEHTPNPNAMKFLPGRVVMEHGILDFPNIKSAECSPLAMRLFAIKGVIRVFFGTNFIIIGKNDVISWDILKSQVLTVVKDHYISGANILLHDVNDTNVIDSDDEIVIQIKDLIDSRVRPSVINDGGDIIFRSFKDGIVYLHMQGACSGCPNSSATLKYGIENMLRHYVPEVVKVIAVD
ncbi:MAG: NifU family protein [Rhodospirillaceae bacterium]|jgi:Fe-S cluster biogenesis protein NfuA|nr:NifU family protein [Rhodospirillaceae bacterium]